MVALLDLALLVLEQFEPLQRLVVLEQPEHLQKELAVVLLVHQRKLVVAAPLVLVFLGH